VSVANEAVRALLWKEVRQIRRSRGAILSATIFPFLLLVVQPIIQIKGLTSTAALAGVSGSILDRFGGPMGIFTHLSVPLFVTLAGVLVAPVIATHTVVSERERGSVDLLLALPASVEEILRAKELSVLLVGAGVVTPMFVLEAVVLTADGLLSLAEAGLLFLVLLGALACSVGVTIVVTVLARDFRTARQLSTLPVAVILFLTVAVLFALPGSAGFLVLALLLLILGALSAVLAQRWLTPDRYLT
jgi:ABC-2 type transport system permease protein